MKEFFRVLMRFVPPYKRYLWLAVFYNILSAVLNVFSFTLLTDTANSVQNKHYGISFYAMEFQSWD